MQSERYFLCMLFTAIATAAATVCAHNIYPTGITWISILENS